MGRPRYKTSRLSSHRGCKHRKHPWVALEQPANPVQYHTYLVPDCELDRVRANAEVLGLNVTTKMPHHIAPSKGGLALGSQADDKLDRTYVFPLLWSGITLDETSAIPGSPSNIRTLPLSTFTIASVRILRRDYRDLYLKNDIYCDITDAVVYNLFDMSYEGDVMEIPDNDVPLSKDEVREIEQASATIRGWKLERGDEWIKEAVIDLITTNSRCLETDNRNWRV